MRTRLCPEPDHSRVALGLHAQLLYGAQSYLKCLRLHEIPDSKSVDAWEEFYMICDSLVRRFAILYCKIASIDLDDCVQSTWEEITRALPAFQYAGHPGAIVAWLRLIVHSKATNQRRYRARHPTRSLRPQVAAKLTSKDADLTAEDQRSQQARLRRVMADLRRQVSPTNYRVLQLRCVKGSTVKEVAMELNLTVAQVRYVCCRMRKKFRLLYEKGLPMDANGEE